MRSIIFSDVGGLRSALCRCLREVIVAYLVDLRLQQRQVGAFRTHIGSGEEESGGETSLDVDVPLLHVTVRVIIKAGDEEVLDSLRCVHLGANCTQSTSNRRHNPGQERSVDGVAWVDAVDRSGVGRNGGIHGIVVWIQAKGKVNRNPEDSITAANDGLLIQTVGKTYAR